MCRHKKWRLLITHKTFITYSSTQATVWTSMSLYPPQTCKWFDSTRAAVTSRTFLLILILFLACKFAYNYVFLLWLSQKKVSRVLLVRANAQQQSLSPVTCFGSNISKLVHSVVRVKVPLVTVVSRIVIHVFGTPTKFTHSAGIEKS